MFASDLRPVSGFLQVLRFPQPIKLTATIFNWNIVESGVKHHKQTQTETEAALYIPRNFTSINNNTDQNYHFSSNYPSVWVLASYETAMLIVQSNGVIYFFVW